MDSDLLDITADKKRISELESEREILLKGFETIFQTKDYQDLCSMQTAMEQISVLYPEEPEPQRITQVLKLVKEFFRAS